MRATTKREAVFEALKGLGRSADAREIARLTGSDYNATSGLLRLLAAGGRVQQKRRRMFDGSPQPSLWRVMPSPTSEVSCGEEHLAASPGTAKEASVSA